MTKSNHVSQPRVITSPGRVISWTTGDYSGECLRGLKPSSIIPQAIRENCCPGVGVLERDLRLTAEVDHISGRAERRMRLLAQCVQEERQVAHAQAERPIDGVFPHDSSDISLIALKVECV